MPTPLSLSDTLDRIHARPAPVQKTAASTMSTSAALRQLGSLLEQLPEPTVTFDSLYVVKEAGFRSVPAPQFTPSPVIDESKPGAPLRKLAHAVRGIEEAQAVAFFEKNARILRALRGLTLLREQASR
jgi:hypothetical protein